jgi:hypothetical protein
MLFGCGEASDPGTVTEPELNDGVTGDSLACTISVSTSTKTVTAQIGSRRIHLRGTLQGAPYDIQFDPRTNVASLDPHGPRGSGVLVGSGALTIAHEVASRGGGSASLSCHRTGPVAQTPALATQLVCDRHADGSTDASIVLALRGPTDPSDGDFVFNPTTRPFDQDSFLYDPRTGEIDISPDFENEDVGFASGFGTSAQPLVLDQGFQVTRCHAE